MIGFVLHLALAACLNSGPGGCALTAPASAQPATAGRPAAQVARVTGTVSIAADFLPRRDATELRPEVTAVLAWAKGTRWRAHAEGAVAALVARRVTADTTAVAQVRLLDTWIEMASARADLRVGAGRLSWGKLDEVQPSDVINPIDSARFFFAGRHDARLAVPFVRGRWFAAEDVTVEGILTPRFRRSRFDQLDEPTSPFNLVNDAILPAGIALGTGEVAHEEPGGASGGARVLATSGRLDWSVSAFRGYDAFGPIEFVADVVPAVVGRLVGRHPRFTMVAADAETVAGDWAIRGEAAWFVQKTLQAVSRPGLVAGDVLEAGAGLDRRAGQSRVFASVLLHREWSAEDPRVARSDVNVVGSVERSFRRERHHARAFVVLNPADASAFVRGLWTWTPADNLSFHASAGTFLGEGDDAIARFKGRDFLIGRLTVHW